MIRVSQTDPLEFATGFAKFSKSLPFCLLAT